jgi:hypothetical protein
MENKAKFPYKTLIWASFALLAILIFKKELKQFLTQAEGVSIFGVEITASKEKMNKLHDSIRNFETTIADLSAQLTNQSNKINNLDKLKTQLEQDLANCPEAKNISRQFSSQVNQIFNANKALKTKSDKLKNSSILKINTYNVTLVLPSNMMDADVFVDGKKANIVKKSGIYLTVKVVKQNNAHHFEVRQGTKRCSTNKLITKDAMEVPIVCNF